MEAPALTTGNNSLLRTKVSLLSVSPFPARGGPVHLVNHLATMADLHRAGRYDRLSDDVRTLTGQEPLSVQEFVRKNAATFTPSTKEAI